MSSAARPFEIPAPHEDDFEDVHWALSAATTLWDRGDYQEGLKWLRRAANAAADRDADLRAVELFKAAADLTSFVESGRGLGERDSTRSKPETLPSLQDPDELPTPDLTPLPPRLTPPPLPALPKGPASTPVSGDVSDREVMLRRALDAMDAHQARPVAPPQRRSASGGAIAARVRQDGRLPALRVALLPIPDEGDVRLVFLPPGERAPRGVVTALLVPPTAEDAELLARLYRECDAKM